MALKAWQSFSFAVGSCVFSRGSCARPRRFFIVLQNVGEDVERRAAQERDVKSFDLKGLGRKRVQDDNARVLWDQNFREWTKGFPVALPSADCRFLQDAVRERARSNMQELSEVWDEGEGALAPSVRPSVSGGSAGSGSGGSDRVHVVAEPDAQRAAAAASDLAHAEAEA